MGELAELLEQIAKKDQPAVYVVPDEEELLAQRVSAESRPVKTYRLSEEERLALIEKYGPPITPAKAEQIKRKYRGLLDWRGKTEKEEEAPMETMEEYRTNEPEERLYQAETRKKKAGAKRKPGNIGMDELREIMTKEKYLEWKAQGKSDREIIEEHSTSVGAFYSTK